MKDIRPAHSNWVRSSATRVNEGKLDPVKIQDDAQKYAVLNGLNDEDIEVLTFLVLMQASKSAQEDLKAIMSKVKSINEKKSKLRQALRTLKAGKAIRNNIQLDSLKRAVGLVKQEPKPIRAVAIKPATKPELDNTLQEVNNELDSMSEMGEMESMQLQRYMDRLTQLNALLSNIMKKVSATSSSIISNLK